MNAPDLKPRQLYEANKLQKRLRRQVGQAIADFDMIRAGDRVMVCLSGGKDSYGLLDVLLNLRAHAPIDFEIVAVNLDQRHPGYPEHVLPNYLKALGVPFRIEVQDIRAEPLEGAAHQGVVGGFDLVDWRDEQETEAGEGRVHTVVRENLHRNVPGTECRGPGTGYQMHSR